MKLPELYFYKVSTHRATRVQDLGTDTTLLHLAKKDTFFHLSLFHNNIYMHRP